MGLKFLYLHLHGLIRSSSLELGRDSDTGGQTQYVLELVKGLANTSQVEQVDLVTRLINDNKVDKSYSKEKEFIEPGAQILRFQFGPNKYLRKELLWPYLDELTHNLINYYKKLDNKPNFIHAHYADAGYVGIRLSQVLKVPLIFTGHSLGREKKRKLIEAGLKINQIEKLYFISKRINAEEEALKYADIVVTSTKQESIYQYSQYNSFSFDKSKVIAPGVNHKKFHHINSTTEIAEIDNMMLPFLKDLRKPPFLAISRAVRRKNIPALVEAYGRSEKLKRKTNLILVLGCRDNTSKLDSQQKDVFQKIFEMIDKYNLYGKVAYPKKHSPANIPALYRWAASRGGIFVNPALTEPFGLTLLEASSCGLPIIATDDGGPKEIHSKCDNGLLVDVSDINKLKLALEQGITNSSQWKLWSRNGIEGVHRHFSWNTHVRKYLSVLSSQYQKSTIDSSSKIKESCLKGSSSLIKPH
ncbi:Sucrose phosphate synthase [Prochlorococcus marinus str. MIT 9515]|uniref:sucrose-phosphate synthase n=1 Tax=Prochlorococcus marinus (strain MIT 9515) TaxID=167542 RepID=A2BZ98_PROM5|nr:glycosyltransferase [Prochlorococcus marinus]ABM73109.1 Sucrose phosphate synthase [Prochlorococcus marinus str. MIT 9515]